MAIKIDLEKAYDRINWDFVIFCLKESNFPPLLINLIRHCISSTSFNILWNGDRTDPFCYSRGIRQGDPLSPYLFVLCMDRLSHIISEKVSSGMWKPMRAGRNGPLISHLMFTDDLLLFAEADVNQMDCVLDCLNKFGNLSGQKVSTQKTKIIFSKNVSQDKRALLCEMSGFSASSSLGRYLGSRVVQGRASKGHFNFIIEKIQSKLSGWTQSCLSRAGRITLAHSVLSSVASFNMQHSKIPKGVCFKIEQAQRNFIWGDTVDKRRPHLVRWDICCTPKVRNWRLGVSTFREDE